MKSNSSLLLAAVVSAALLQTGCRKQLSTEVPVASHQKVYVPSKSFRHSGPALTYYTFGTDITEAHLLPNPDDAADEQFNYVQYALTLGLLQIYGDSSLTGELVEAVINEPGKCYDLFDFADEHAAVDQVSNNVFSIRFADFSSYGSNWRNYVEAKYVYDVSYRPFAYFANEGVYDLSEEVYVGAPFEVNEESFPEFDDDIPVWINDADGGRLFTTINEEKAGQTRNPILLISNGHVGDAKVTSINFKDRKDPTPNYGCPTSGHIHEKLSHRKFKINERYEGTGKSEYTFVWVARLPYYASTMSWGSGQAYAYEQKKVDKNDIGSIIYFDFKAFNAGMWPSNSNPYACFEINLLASSSGLYSGYAVGAYESDWFNTNKFLLSTNDGTQVIKSRGARKYDSEWYFLAPSTNDSYPFNVRNPTPNSIYTNTTKGELWLERNFDL